MRRVWILLLCAAVLGMTACSPSGGAAPDMVETEHFILYNVGGDAGVLPEIADRLEDEYARVCGDLDVEPAGAVKVRVFPDLKAFHKAIGRADTPDWLAGAMYMGELYIVSPENPGPMHTRESAMSGAVHEFIHLLTHSINPFLPLYLAEGVSEYESGSTGNVGAIVEKMLDEDSLPSMDKLETLTGEEGLYELSCVFVEYVVSEYGYESLRTLLKTANRQEALGKDDAEIYEEWKAFLANTYIK